MTKAEIRIVFIRFLSDNVALSNFASAIAKNSHSSSSLKQYLDNWEKGANDAHILIGGAFPWHITGKENYWSDLSMKWAKKCTKELGLLPGHGYNPDRRVYGTVGNPLPEKESFSQSFVSQEVL